MVRVGGGPALGSEGSRETVACSWPDRIDVRSPAIVLPCPGASYRLGCAMSRGRTGGLRECLCPPPGIDSGTSALWLCLSIPGPSAPLLSVSRCTSHWLGVLIIGNTIVDIYELEGQHQLVGLDVDMEVLLKEGVDQLEGGQFQEIGHHGPLFGEVYWHGR